MMSPLRVLVLSERIAWNVAAPLLATRLVTSLHSMMRLLPSIFQSTALSVAPASVLVRSVRQSSQRMATAACVGEVLKSVFVNAVVDEPREIRPLALAKIVE